MLSLSLSVSLCVSLFVFVPRGNIERSVTKIHPYVFINSMTLAARASHMQFKSQVCLVLCNPACSITETAPIFAEHVKIEPIRNSKL